MARSTNSEEDVLFLLKCTPKLKLHLGLAYLWFRERVFEKGKFLIQSLEPFHNTMEAFSLDLDYYPSGFGESHHDDEHEDLWEPSHGILKKFTNLQTAGLSANVLLGFDARETAETTNLSDVLPSTLRELVIRDDLVALGEAEWEDRRIYDHVLAFLPNWRTSTPFLRDLTLRLWNGHYERMYSEDEEEMCSVCEEAGLPLDIVLMICRPRNGLRDKSWEKRYNVYIYHAINIHLLTQKAGKSRSRSKLGPVHQSFSTFHDKSSSNNGATG